MISKNKVDAVFYTLFVCCSLVLTPASMADLRRTRRDAIKIENYTCSNDGKHNKNHPTETPIIDPTCHNVMDKTVDDDVYITCHVKSNPAAKITWFFNGKPLNFEDRSQRHKQDATSCSQKLHITYARIDDSGAYTCVASNEYGTVNHTCELTVRARDRSFHVINNGIRLHGVSASGKAVIGSPLNMSCEVYNVHFVYWTKNGVRFPPKSPPNPENPARISTSKKRKRATVFVQYLVFTHVFEKDQGNYSCAGRDMIFSETIHSYKYLETVSTPVSAQRKSSLSSRKSAIPCLAYLFLLGFSLSLNYLIMV